MTERTTHAELPDAFRRVIRWLCHAVTPDGVTWAVTGSAGFVLQGVPVAPTGIDVETDEGGAYKIERRLDDHVVDPVPFSEGCGICSHLGRSVLDRIRVPVFDLRYEERAHRCRGRVESADLLRSVIEQRRPEWT